MSVDSARTVRRFLPIFLFAFVTGLTLYAQQPRVMAPHRPIAPKVAKLIPLGPSVQGSMVGGPWIIDANFKSSIYLKNVVETSPVTITPVLYLSNGAKYVLHDVILEPAGTAIIDVNAGLAAQGIASYATLSGYIELQYAWPWNPICAMIRDVDIAHSLIFTFGIQAPPSASPQSSLTAVPAVHITEGVWWKQEGNVTGFVSLANTTSQPLTAKVQISDSRAAILGVHTVTISPHGMKTLDMQELHSAPTSAGGLRVSYLGPQDALLLNGGLEDQSVGYSANLRFISSLAAPVLPPSSHLTAPTSVATLGLMVGAADPMMSFPAGTTFTPYSVLRNTSSSPITVTPTLWWMQAGGSHSAPLAAISLLPYQTRSLDMTLMLSRAGLKNLNGSVNLTFDVQGKVNGLLIAAGSVDQTNTYVFEVAPRGIVESAGKSLSYWSTGNGDDTMVTLWNPADEAQDFQFRLSFSGGHYGVPIHLEPRATRVFNISEIIQNQVPDAEGNIVPPTVQMGSAKLVGANADNESILVAMDSGVYNVRKAMCGGSCMSCDGATGFSALSSPFALAVGGQRQETFLAQWGTGGQYDYTSQGTWSSSKTTVATVQSGLGRGVSTGSVSFYVSDSSIPIYIPYTCFGYAAYCPISQGGGASAPGTVEDFNLSAAQSIMDGGQGTFSMTVTGGTAQSYQWSFTAPNTAGNGPNVTFSAATSANTNTDGHWFALPNVACPSQADIPAYYNSVYNITGAITFNDGTKITHNSTLTVDSLWSPAGITDPNIAKIGGIPAMAAANGVWRVTAMGTLSRVVPTSSTIYVIPNSQFHNKTVQHEQVHVNNWILGAGHLYGDLYIPADFYNQIKNTTGTTQADLINKLSAALTTYVNAEGVIVGQRHNQDEHQAYAVSDPIAPQYVYQNCGRY